MHELTQSTDSNCWQTAIACLLDLDPAVMPDQTAIETAGGSYLNALQAYLEKHFNLMYIELYDYQLDPFEVKDPGLHLLVGKTMRTRPDTGINHCVVAKKGVMIWDPHPSRAGLTQVTGWGALGKLPESIRTWRNASRAKGLTGLACLCPYCLD